MFRFEEKRNRKSQFFLYKLNLIRWISPNRNRVLPLVLNNKICLCFQTSWSLISNDQRYIVCFNSIPWGPSVDMHLPTWDFICIWKWVSLTSLKLNPPTAYCPCKMAKHSRWLLLLLCGLEYFRVGYPNVCSIGTHTHTHKHFGFSAFYRKKTAHPLNVNCLFTEGNQLFTSFASQTL